MTGRYTILDSVETPMRDGTVLRADVWLPDGDGPWPVFLDRTPYAKDLAFGVKQFTPHAFLRQGYAVVMQDTRGRYHSEGAFEPFVHEAEDGCDTIAWVRAQSFCDGRVAMFGQSYVGATQILAATANPPGLVATAPLSTTARHGETWMYRDGALEFGLLMFWMIEALSTNDLARRKPGMDPQTAAQATAALATFQKDPWAAFARLPVIDDTLRLLGPYLEDWLSPERAAKAAQDDTNLRLLGNCQSPMLVIGGTYDIFMDGSVELFETILTKKPEALRGRDRFIFGPWAHANPSGWQGEEWMGYSASQAELFAAQMAYFADILAGRTPDCPLVRYFRGGSNTWHASDVWPLAGVEQRPLYLDGHELSAAEPAADWSRDYVSNPANPVPTVGGCNFLPGMIVAANSGPKEQSVIERRGDVLLFTSAPLELDIEVTGLVVAHLWVNSTAPTCDWTVKLCEVDASGKSIGRIDGILRWTNANPGTGEPIEVTVKLGHISHLFPAGCRLRVQVASSNFPRFDRNPQSGASSVFARPEDLRSADQTISGGARRPSRVVLPVVVSQGGGAVGLTAVTNAWKQSRAAAG